MASTKVFGGIPLANTFLDDPKKCKKKKSKKAKKEKSDKQKSRPKVGQRLKDRADIGDLNLYEQWSELKKKKRKKKQDVGLNVEFPLTQNKNLKLSKKHKNNQNNYHASESCAVGRGVRSCPGARETLQPILSSVQKEKKHKKRVVFNLSPVLLEPKPLQNLYAVRDVLQTQRSGIDKKPSFNAGGHHSKPAVEEHRTESQSTSDDINSQDLFITQKTFSDPYIDLCSSASVEEPPEPQGYTATSPEPQSNSASSVKKETSSVPSPSPEHQYYTASYPEPQSIPKKPPSSLNPPSHHPKLDASTQTENFFTSPVLATSLRLRHWSMCTEAPIDLSLPKRSRLHQQEIVSQACEDQNVRDLTQSDDSDEHLKSKADLSQLKVVQMRLNESFFFKLKGDPDSPKPRSPLMKLAGNVEKKKP
ncbi:E3 ubiquitin-protein ligase RNF12-B-like [Clarias magur]|uniref:E3 ubiquitin-protein ligase RNF12-B-like n=1 Tax=Clarias magur TaxID=1594786 RepID=A0A8J4WZH2_CLAMG|nr:E3 ubiquitin-protein ligase RNF12-B-like [Clarias magur]